MQIITADHNSSRFDSTEDVMLTHCYTILVGIIRAWIPQSQLPLLALGKCEYEEPLVSPLATP